MKYVIENNEGRWIFNPKYQNNVHDDLPEDAWTGFLQERDGKVSTRLNVFPFSIKEQKQILTVGTCLHCHDQNSRLMNTSLVDFQRLLDRKSEECVLPVW